MDRFLVQRAQPPDVIPDMTHNASAVSSLTDLLRWPHANSYAAVSSGIIAPTYLLHAGMVKTSSLTSTFSGICAETVASNMLHAYIQDNGFPDTTKFRHLASVERDHECRLEQSVVPHGACCRFGNIMDFCTPQTAKHLEAHFTAGTCDLDTLAPVILAPGAIKSTAFCSAHNKQCSFPRATGHSAGVLAQTSRHGGNRDDSQDQQCLIIWCG